MATNGPPKPSRKDFVDYEAKARRNYSAAAKKRSRKEWAQLTAQQKENFRAALEARDRARAVARTQQDIANASKAAAEQPIAGDRTWDRVIEEYDLASEEFAKAASCYEEAVAEGDNFRAVVTLVYAGQAAVVARALRERNEDEQARVQTRQEATTMQRAAGNPPNFPGRADGAVKMPEIWVPEKNLLHLKNTRRAEFMAGPPLAADDNSERSAQEPGTWIGAWPLSGGGQGFTGLWVKLDNADTVIDRVVEKVTYLDRQQWASAVNFAGDVHDADNRMPSEIDCHQALSDMFTHYASPDGRVPVPRLKFHYVDNQNRSYRIGMAYSSYGDLSNLTRRHHNPFPESFLWRVLHSLAEVGRAMRIGNGYNHPPDPDWKDIIHRDLKPGNIFLAEAGDEFFPRYPRPLVVDFGAAIRTTPSDVLNPTMYQNGVLTRGFFAPEQLSYIDTRNGESVDEEKLLAHTNIYGIGITMYGLLIKARPRQRDFLGDGHLKPIDVRADADRATGPGEQYSDRLVKLIQDCISFQPAARPTYQQIFDEIDDAIHEDEGENVLNGMMTAAVSDEPTAEDLKYAARDRYAEGLARDTLPNLV